MDRILINLSERMGKVGKGGKEAEKELRVLIFFQYLVLILGGVFGAGSRGSIWRPYHEELIMEIVMEILFVVRGVKVGDEKQRVSELANKKRGYKGYRERSIGFTIEY